MQRITIETLAELYEAFARDCYRRDDGSATGEHVNVQYAMKDLVSFMGQEDVTELRPLRVTEFRSRLIARRLARTTINKRMAIIRRALRWAVQMELIDGSVLATFSAIEPLRAGRHGAKEPRPKTAVDLEDIEATLREIESPQVRAMIRLQALTGMRPGEVLMMRGRDIHVENGQWMYHPRRHKTEHHGKPRVIPLGPKARTIIADFLVGRDPDRYLFSPLDAPGPKGRRKADHYSVSGYRSVIQRACDMAGVERWSPNQLRHTAATQIGELYGAEAVQAVPGHAKLETSRIYDHSQFQVALRIMEEIG
ncbi:MAG: tyrosine-type recombinase/integrase [Planctomycetota bacterium]